jgi:hypothetical protein
MLLIVSDRVIQIFSVCTFQMRFVGTQIKFFGTAEFGKMAAERGKTRGQDVEDVLKFLYLINLI